MLPISTNMKVNTYQIQQLESGDYFLICKLPNDLFKSTDEQIKKIQNGYSFPKANNSLVGFIKDEFEFKIDNLLFENIKSLTTTLNNNSCYSEKFTNIFNEKLKGIEFEDLGSWINFQKKYEYNPQHTHKGLYSWTIWHTIPYDLEIEKQQSPGREANFPNQVASFNFHFNTPLGVNIHNIELSKEYEKCICIFPSTLAHSVHPFYTSDGVRISFSGNIGAKLIQ